ncbi:MAG: MTAP family purine nucleoside phosphorylase [Phycisphaerales bacterium]|nr:MTAP family purine nucleoside phosphorylase [Phycisphaerales bacterium]
MSEIKIGLIGGSGLGAAMGGQEGVRHEVETPFGRPSDVIIETRWFDVPVLMLSRHGPGHLLNPTRVPYRANLFALKQLGCTHIIASGAVGSLRDEFGPRDLVVVDQIIDKTHRREGSFYEKGAVHVEFAEPFCPVMRQMVMEAAGEMMAEESAAAGTAEVGMIRPMRVHGRGCYVCMEGPAFSTRAESLMHRLWGGDLIGMTAMPEAKLAREAELPYVLLALVTDYDCWKAHAAGTEPQKLLEEIIGNLSAAGDHAMRLMRHAVRLMGSHPMELESCPAREALKLAIWSDKSRIGPDEVARLRPLWGRYFE